jgi:4,5-DOPA dioxygenase extradiol
MKRGNFLRLLALLPLLKANDGLAQLLVGNPLPYTEKMPVFFVGHQDFSKIPHLTPFTKNLRAMGALVKPSAIMVISAHGLSWGKTFISVNERYSVPEYPSLGSPEMARFISTLVNVTEQESELDHGAWSVLRHIAPDASVPVLEMSIDMMQPFEYHYSLAKELSNLRKRGVLIIGSGNIVHNLELSSLRFWTKKPYEWALEFDEWVKSRIDNRDIRSLFNYHLFGKFAKYAVPTTDHYLPMLYALSLCEVNEDIVYTYEEVTKGLSYRCFRIN